MAKTQFALWLKGPECCDYSYFRCGEVLIELKARTREEAEKEALERVREDLTGEQPLEVAKLIEVGDLWGFDLGALQAEVAAAEDAQIKAAQEKQERMELMRLQAKYGDG